MNLLLLFGAGSLCIAWLIAGHYFPWLSAQMEFAAAFGGLLIGAAVLFAKRTVWPVLALVAMAAAAVPLLQWAAGQIRFVSDAVLAAGYLAGFGLSIAAGGTLAREKQVDVTGLVLSALGAAAIVCVGIGLKQWVDQGTGVFIDLTGPGSRIYGNFGQPNHLSTALAIGACAVLLGHSRGKLGSPVTGLALAFLAWGIVMTQSRTGWLFVTLLAVGVLALRRRASLTITPLTVIASASLFALAAWSWAPLNDLLLLTTQTTAESRLASGSLRLMHWQVISDAIMQKPWFGYGWTQVVLAQKAAAASHPATHEMLTSSHNIVLDLLAWNGIPLGLFFIACLVWWFVRQLRHCVDADRAFALAAIGAVLLHAMLEYPLEYAYFLFPIGLLMGALDNKAPASPHVTSPRSTYAAPLVALLALFALAAQEYFGEVDPASRTLRFVSAGIGTDKVSSAPEPSVFLLDRAQSIHRFVLTPARIDADPAYLQWVRDVADRRPFPFYMLRHALAAGLNGQSAEAAQVLIRLCKLHSLGACDEGRMSWTLFQRQYPALASIRYPASEIPPALTRPR